MEPIPRCPRHPNAGRLSNRTKGLRRGWFCLACAAYLGEAPPGPSAGVTQRLPNTDDVITLEE